MEALGAAAVLEAVEALGPVAGPEVLEALVGRVPAAEAMALGIQAVEIVKSRDKHAKVNRCCFQVA